MDKSLAAHFKALRRHEREARLAAMSGHEQSAINHLNDLENEVFSARYAVGDVLRNKEVN